MEKIETAVVPEEKKFKVIVDANIARHLLHEGFVIADIKARKGYPRESVFVFVIERDFLERVDYYSGKKNVVKK